jgi:DNA-binding NtrC family response regulator
MSCILIVDDNDAMREQYAYDLKRLAQHDILTAADGDQALEILADQAVDCVVLDLEMPGRDGFGVLQEMQKKDIDVPVVVYTGTGDYARCVRAVQLGAWGFIDKGEPTERVAREIENALAHQRMAREISALRSRHERDSALVGRSQVMENLRGRIAKLAPIPSPVLILGESGTGKEIVARELHRLGAHPAAPLVAVNCAALPENLAESELFGHQRGAFTGADRLRRGAFESAGEGTLFLDEVGELPLPLQAKLLRVLEGGEYTRIGSTTVLKNRSRVVAATNRDLDVEVQNKRFREDLLYRLNVHTLPVPPLRERLDDVPPLVNHFLRDICERHRINFVNIHDEALAGLMQSDWRRNNVRELRNIVERLVIECGGKEIDAAVVNTTLGEGRTSHSTGTGTLAEQREDAERGIIRAALQRNDGHLTRTAAALGLADHASLSKIMKRLGMK